MINPKHIEEAANDIVQFVEDYLADAEVDEPAGRGAGYNIKIDDDGLKSTIIERLQRLLK